MSATGAVTTQDPTHFYLTQEIWKQAWHSQDSSSMTALCAKIACIVFPIILSVAIVEAIVWIVRSVLKISSDPKRAPLDPQSVKQMLPEIQQPTIEPSSIDAPITEPAGSKDDTVENSNILTVALPEGSSLYAIPSPRMFLNNPIERIPPSACVYHALEAVRYAAGGYNIDGNDQLVRFQRQMIELGNRAYFAALKKDPTLKDTADLESILKNREDLRDGRLYFEPVNQEPKPVVERVQAIVEHLFIPHQDEPQPQMEPSIVQIALVKSGNKETIALVSIDGVVIVFNSHKNEITFTFMKEATQAYLTKILAPHAVIKEGVDQNPFSYALGTKMTFLKRRIAYTDGLFKI